MSKRSAKANSRFRAQKQAAWFDLPRRLSRYEATLLVLAGVVFLGMARQELSGRGIDAHTVGTWKSGSGATAPGSETAHFVIGALIAPLALGMIAVGVAGLCARRRQAQR